MLLEKRCGKLRSCSLSEKPFAEVIGVRYRGRSDFHVVPLSIARYLRLQLTGFSASDVDRGQCRYSAEEMCDG